MSSDVRCDSMGLNYYCFSYILGVCCSGRIDGLAYEQCVSAAVLARAAVSRALLVLAAAWICNFLHGRRNFLSLMEGKLWCTWRYDLVFGGRCCLNSSSNSGSILLYAGALVSKLPFVCFLVAASRSSRPHFTVDIG